MAMAMAAAAVSRVVLPADIGTQNPAMGHGHCHTPTSFFLSYFLILRFSLGHQHIKYGQEVYGVLWWKKSIYIGEEVEERRFLNIGVSAGGCSIRTLGDGHTSPPGRLMHLRLRKLL